MKPRALRSYCFRKGVTETLFRYFNTKEEKGRAVIDANIALIAIGGYIGA
jgi:hypothetical protein